MTDKQRPFGVSMTEREFAECLHADEAAFRSPIPTQMVSNGEYNPLPQTEKQKKVEFLIKEMADKEAKRHNMSRRDFLATSSGMATAFMAMNQVYGNVFDSAMSRRRTRMRLANARRSTRASLFLMTRPTSSAMTLKRKACSV